MCILAVAYQVIDSFPLVLIGNRDEFYHRPTQALHRWQIDQQTLIGGRDAKAGGTWLGAHEGQQKLAVVTNVRRPDLSTEGLLSRGALVTDFLLNPKFESGLKPEQYAPYNLLTYDQGQLRYLSNQFPSQTLSAGIYALSNGELDSAWPKVTHLKQQFSEQLEQLPELSQLWTLLRDDRKPSDEQLPETGVGQRLEKLLSSIFIQSPTYGTRSSHIVLVDHSHRVSFYEQRFGIMGRKKGQSLEQFSWATT
ncbi:MAG: NRDE family protein [Pseudomonadota bacterium]|nr:NRDE family protein [Pseudomonadota bacterium]